MVVIDADVGGVAEELRRIDPGLRVRFAARGNPPCWAIMYQHCGQHKDWQPDCPFCTDDERMPGDLVFTRKAWQNRSGVWEGLTHEVVDRVRMIDPRGTGGYDYAKEVERQNQAAEAAKDRRVRERVGEHGELLAWGIRKDLGKRYRGRAFITTPLNKESE